jgi:hypothetical protein
VFGCGLPLVLGLFCYSPRPFEVLQQTRKSWCSAKIGEVLLFGFEVRFAERPVHWPASSHNRIRERFAKCVVPTLSTVSANPHDWVEAP